jgi:hypothetical protein
MSDKPLSERLQVKKDRRLAVIGAPDALEALIGAAEARAGPDQAEIVLLFLADRAAFEAQLPPLAARLRPDAILWLAYPKLSSPLAGDLSRDVVHRLAAAHGLDTVSQIAVDADWSALRVKRVP